jgi:hypothetical protein
LNLEGLAPTPEGHLLRGFGNPVPDGLALVVALRNPAKVIDRVAPPALSIAGRLDLGGGGIRAIEFVPESETYLIIAGAYDDARDFRLYKWSGAPHAEAVALDVDMQDCKPEEFGVFVAGACARDGALSRRSVAPGALRGPVVHGPATRLRSPKASYGEAAPKRGCGREHATAGSRTLRTTYGRTW